jgi:hypothetical protein
MICLRIKTKCNNYSLIREKFKELMNKLKWEESPIPTRVIYGKRCVPRKLSENEIEVRINDESGSISNEKSAIDFLKTLRPYEGCIDYVKIICNGETSDIVSNYAFDSPINDSNKECYKNEFIKINYLIIK